MYKDKHTNKEMENRRQLAQADQNIEHDKQAIEWVISQKQVSDKMLVLDLGCADGTATKNRFQSYEKYISKVIGVDIVDEKIQTAREKNFGNKYDFLTQDIEANKFSEAMQEILKRENKKGFDLIFGAYILVHVVEPQQLLARLLPILEQGKYVAFREPDDSCKVCYPDNENSLQTIITSFASLPRVEDRFFSRKIPYLFTQAGFEPKVCIYQNVGTEGLTQEEKMRIFKVTFDHRRPGYDILTESEKVKYADVLENLGRAIDIMEHNFQLNDFYFEDTKRIHIATKNVR